MFALVGGTGLDSLPNSWTAGAMVARGARIGVTPAGTRFAFLPRHGPGHTALPHQIDHIGHIEELKALGVDRILAVHAVGSLRHGLGIGHMVIPDSFIDLTRRGQFTRHVAPGSPIVHTDFSGPYCPALRQAIQSAGRAATARVHGRGTLICTDGPRFETPAEITAFRSWGADIIGMTGATEAIIARELGICYASICVVGNMAAGMGPSIDSREVEQVVAGMRSAALDLAGTAIDSAGHGCSCRAR